MNKTSFCFYWKERRIRSSERNWIRGVSSTGGVEGTRTHYGDVFYPALFWEHRNRDEEICTSTMNYACNGIIFFVSGNIPDQRDFQFPPRKHWICVGAAGSETKRSIKNQTTPFIHILYNYRNIRFCVTYHLYMTLWLYNNNSVSTNRSVWYDLFPLTKGNMPDVWFLLPEPFEVVSSKFSIFLILPVPR